jgi:hypothetical protein
MLDQWTGAPELSTFAGDMFLPAKFDDQLLAVIDNRQAALLVGAGDVAVCSQPSGSIASDVACPASACRAAYRPDPSAAVTKTNTTLALAHQDIRSERSPADREPGANRTTALVSRLLGR